MKKLFLFLTIFVFCKLVYAVTPSLVAIPTPQNFTDGQLYTYDVDATEGVGTLVFSDDSPNFDIDSSTGFISFTPSNDLIGSFIAVILVRDDNFDIDAQAVNFTVNGVPYFTDLEDSSVTVGDQFYYDVNATDPEEGSNIDFLDNSDLFVINLTTGVINFTTQESDIGEYTINITLNDTLGAQNSSSFVLSINDWPNVTAIPNGSVQEDETFNLNISQYVNNSVGSLNFTDDSDFFVINLTTGIIDFTPNISMVSDDNLINITVTDEFGLFDSGTFYLNITEANDAPFFSEISNQSGKVGVRFVLDINSTDEEGDTITYYDDSDLFVINSTTGLINFSVDSGMVGVHTINITVGDDNGANYSDDFILNLYENTANPSFGKNFTISINPNSDAYIDSAFPTTNYGGGDYLYVSDVTGSIKRAYLNFSLSDLPSDAYVFLANLNLTVNMNVTGKNVSLYLVNQSWYSGNVTYNNQPPVYGAVDVIGSSINESYDSFDISSEVRSWVDGSFVNNGVSVRFQNESTNIGLIKYYSRDSSNSSKWPFLYVIYNRTIANQTVVAGSNLTNILDLDDYFYDLDSLDTLTYSVDSPSLFNASIDSDNNLSIYTFLGSSGGSDEIIITATDGIGSAYSNAITITVIGSTSVSSSGGGGGGRARTAALSINLDSKKESVPLGDIFQLPLVIQNIGEVTVNNIQLSASPDKPGVGAFLSEEEIKTLGVGEEYSILLTLDTTNSLMESYIITLLAASDSPKVNASSIFVLDVFGSGESIEKELIFAQDLFENNPECLELKELIDSAQLSLNSGDYQSAQSNIAIAIESCRQLVKGQTPTLSESSNKFSLTNVLMFMTLLTLLIFGAYIVFRKIKYKA